MNADDIAALLGLVPLPDEGGRWRSTWRDEHGSAIYYLMVPDDFSALHRLDATEIWHHYAGDPVEMLLLHPSGAIDRPLLGDDLSGGARPQIAVPGQVWMAATTLGSWSLVGTTMAPPYADDGFELGDRATLTARYPEAADDIVRFLPHAGGAP